MRYAIFNTKIANDLKHNGEKVEVLEYQDSDKIWNRRYIIKFNNGKKASVYANEIEFID